MVVKKECQIFMQFQGYSFILLVEPCVLPDRHKQSDECSLEYLQLDFSQTKGSDEATWSDIKFREILVYLLIYIHTYLLYTYLPTLLMQKPLPFARSHLLCYSNIKINAICTSLNNTYYSADCVHLQKPGVFCCLCGYMGCPATSLWTWRQRELFYLG